MRKRVDFRLRGLAEGKLRRLRYHRYRATKSLLWTVAVGLALYALTEKGESAFTFSDDGWRIVGNGRAAALAPQYVGTGGNPGGYVLSADQTDLAMGPALPMDIVIVFDLTGSMDRHLNAVRNQAIEIIRTLRQRSSAIRLGLIGFRDRQDNPATAIEQFPPTASLDEQFERMRGWSADGGGDDPEDLFFGIAKALDMMKTARPQSSDQEARVTHAIIAITDAPPKSPDADGNTLDSFAGVIRKAGIRIYSIIPGADPKASKAALRLAQETNGEVLSGAGAAQVAESLLETVEVAVEAGDPRLWQVPRKLLAEVAAAEGKALSFDLKQSCDSGRQFDGEDVILTGDGITLVFDIRDNPGGGWTHYTVPLNAGGWTNRATGRQPSAAEFRQALSTVSALQIRAEYCVGPDTAGLDNFLIDEDAADAGAS